MNHNIFPSDGGWSLLIGKPLLKQLRVVHNYEMDTIKLPRKDGTYDLLANDHSESPDTTQEKTPIDKQNKPKTVITSIEGDTRRER